MRAERRVGPETHGVDDRDDAAEVFHAFSEHDTHHGGREDHLDVTRIREQRRGCGRRDKHAVADQTAADAGNEREEEHADDVVATLDPRERARERKGKGRAEVKKRRQLKRSGRHGRDYGRAEVSGKAGAWRNGSGGGKSCVQSGKT